MIQTGSDNVPSSNFMSAMCSSRAMRVSATTYEKSVLAIIRVSNLELVIEISEKIYQSDR